MRHWLFFERETTDALFCCTFLTNRYCGDWFFFFCARVPTQRWTSRNKRERERKTAVVAPSVRKVPQLYSPKASYIATQLYLGYAQVIFASRVLKANISPQDKSCYEEWRCYAPYWISLKLQVSISLFRNISPKARYSKEYHCETCLTISLNILIFEIG